MREYFSEELIAITKDKKNYLLNIGASLEALEIQKTEINQLLTLVDKKDCETLARARNHLIEFFALTHYKVSELNKGLVTEINGKNIFVCFLICRQLIEYLVILREVNKHLEKGITNSNSKDLHKLINAGRINPEKLMELFGNPEKLMQKRKDKKNYLEEDEEKMQKNILGVLKKNDPDGQLTSLYMIYSEIIHPNKTGIVFFDLKNYQLIDFRYAFVNFILPSSNVLQEIHEEMKKLHDNISNLRYVKL